MAKQTEPIKEPKRREAGHWGCAYLKESLQELRRHQAHREGQPAQFPVLPLREEYVNIRVIADLLIIRSFCHLLSCGCTAILRAKDFLIIQEQRF